MSIALVRFSFQCLKSIERLYGWRGAPQAGCRFRWRLFNTSFGSRDWDFHLRTAVPSIVYTLTAVLSVVHNDWLPAGGFWPTSKAVVRRGFLLWVPHAASPHSGKGTNPPAALPEHGAQITVGGFGRKQTKRNLSPPLYIRWKE